jgi:imidazolonepropionase-like amidohydrolase
MGKQVGTLEKGKLADFLVLSANPLDDIKNTRTIESVWIGGVQVPANK